MPEREPHPDYLVTNLLERSTLPQELVERMEDGSAVRVAASPDHWWLHDGVQVREGSGVLILGAHYAAEVRSLLHNGEPTFRVLRRVFVSDEFDPAAVLDALEAKKIKFYDPPDGGGAIRDIEYMSRTT